MELNFKQNEQLNYEAEFKVEGPFNIHLETLNKCSVQILQKNSLNNKYANSATLDCDKVLNYDINCLIYPKWIKIISGASVLYAEVLSEKNITV